MSALILLPGLDGTATLHSDFVAAVGAVFDSVSVVSYPPDQLLDYAALEALVRAALPAEGPFVLLGESFSGPIALSIAAKPPGNLAGVVLSTTFAASPVPWLSPLARFTRIAPVRVVPRAVWAWWLLGRWATPGLEAKLAAALLTVEPRVLRFRAALALRADVLACCRDVSVPVLYLRATEDRLMSACVGQQVCAAIPRCVLAQIEGPHLLLQAVPEGCAEAVGTFVARLG